MHNYYKDKLILSCRYQGYLLLVRAILNCRTSETLPDKRINIELELPEGQVKLNSPFYLERPPIETTCYQTIINSGSLIRIKAPRQMGKVL